MRLLLQRVASARVTDKENGRLFGEIGPGLLVLVGFGQGDSTALFPKMTDKVLNLRIFEDQDAKMNRSVQDIGGALLLVSQFTLHADCRRGRRPSFTAAAPPDQARTLYEQYVQHVRSQFSGTLQTGEFAAMMNVELINSGPVTIWLDSNDLMAD